MPHDDVYDAMRYVRETPDTAWTSPTWSFPTLSTDTTGYQIIERGRTQGRGFQNDTIHFNHVEHGYRPGDQVRVSWGDGNHQIYTVGETNMPTGKPGIGELAQAINRWLREPEDMWEHNGNLLFFDWNEQSRQYETQFIIDREYTHRSANAYRVPRQGRETRRLAQPGFIPYFTIEADEEPGHPYKTLKLSKRWGEPAWCRSDVESLMNYIYSRAFEQLMEEAPMATVARSRATAETHFKNMNTILIEKSGQPFTEPIFSFAREALRQWVGSDNRRYMSGSRAYKFELKEDTSMSGQRIYKYKATRVAPWEGHYDYGRNVENGTQSLYEIVQAFPGDYQVMVTSHNNDVETLIIVPVGSFFREFYVVTRDYPKHDYSVTGGCMRDVWDKISSNVTDVPADQEQKVMMEAHMTSLMNKLKAKVRERVEVMNGDDPATKDIMNAIPKKGGIVITKGKDPLSTGGVVGHIGAIYFKDQRDNIWKAFLRNRKNSVIVPGDDQTQKVLDAIDGTQSLTKEQRMRAIGRIFKSLKNSLPNRLSAIEKEIKEIREQLNFKPPDAAPWAKEGFSMNFNMVNMTMELTYVFQGYTLMKRYDIHVPFEFKMTFDMKGKRLMHANARCEAYGRFHPHVHSSDAGSWASVCMGSFPEAFNEMVFVENSPHMLKGQLLLWASRYNAKSPACAINSFGWKFALDKKTGNMATLREIENYYETFIKENPRSSGAVQIEGFGADINSGEALEI